MHSIPKFFQLALAVLVLASPSQAQIAADNSVDVLCRKDQLRGASSLVKANFLELSRCHTARLRGRVGPAIDCNDIANAVSPLRLERERAKLRKRINNACDGVRRAPASLPAVLGYTACPAPCAAVDIGNTWSGQANCLVCQAEHQAETLAAEVFGELDASVDRDAQRCLTQLTRAASSYLSKRLLLFERCQQDKDAGKLDPTTNCTSDSPDALARLQARLSRSVARCELVDLAQLDSCGATPAEVDACLLDAAGAAAATMAATGQPPIPAPTATPTITPTTTATPTATATPDRPRAIQVSTSGRYSCAVFDNGDARCWGSGQRGVLGLGNTDDIGDDETPGSVDPIDFGPGRTAVQISVYGSSRPPRLDAPFACAILDDGSVRCWGANNGANLGYGSAVDANELIGDDESPGSLGPVDLGPGRTALQIATGRRHACAVLDDHSVRCWGSQINANPSDGRLGYGNTDVIGNDETPGSVDPVDLGAGRTALQVACGEDHTCVILDDHTVKCWGAAGSHGYPNTGNIGDDETPATVGTVDLGPGRTALQITAAGFGFPNTCAVLDDHSVRCWGDNTYAQLGYGPASESDDFIGDDETPGSVGPVDLGPGRTALQVTTYTFIRGGRTCVLLDDHSVKCWGLGNNSGTLGYGNTDPVDDPAEVGSIDLGAGRTAVQISTSFSHTCAVLDDGSVKCWGGGGPQLGYPDIAESIGDDETPGDVDPIDFTAP